MDDVIDLDSRRSDESGNVACECGSEWFRLVPVAWPEGGFGTGCVVLGQDLSIGGYSGALLCAQCHKELPAANPYSADA